MGLTVDEPNGPQSFAVPILLMRDGTAGQATVSWKMKSSNRYFTSNDVDAVSGSVVFPQGTYLYSWMPLSFPNDHFAAIYLRIFGCI